MRSLNFYLLATLTTLLAVGCNDDTSQEPKEEFQQFLDNNQYTRNGILRYEYVFGDGFISTGGQDTTRELTAMLDLKPGDRVLDVGAGIGGSARYMAKHYGADVTGIDLSQNMIAIAVERADKDEDKVSFEVADILTQDYPENSFDVIYSRDTFLHIAEKEALFKKFRQWLKPGGQLLISDYCRGADAESEEFKAYVAQRNYQLTTVKKYGQVLSNAGFASVKAIDHTERFSEVLRDELARIQQNKDDFVSEFSQRDYDDIVNGWEAKLERIQRGEQKWGVFIAS